MERVSIIIPAYNADLYLDKCLESCINQTYSNIEIILVLDGCTDNSSEIAIKFQEKDNRIEIIDQQNKGVALSRRVGFEASRGTYVFFLDADDYIKPETIEMLVMKLTSKDADVVIGGTIFENNQGSYITKWISNIESDSRIDCLKAIFNSTIQPVIWGRLIKRELFQPVHVPNMWGEDFLANVLIICNAQRIKMTSESALLYHYRVYNESFTNKTKGEPWLIYTDEIARILCEFNLENDVMAEWSYFRVIKTWRFYLRRGGKKYLNDKKYVNEFYRKYYSIVKSKLSYIERLELNLYRYNQFLAYNFSRVYIKYLKITHQPVN